MVWMNMKNIDLSIPSGAIFSDDSTLRFVLWRVWDNQKPILGQVGLNPSTAGVDKNDATIARSIVRGQKYGFGGLIQTNKYPHIATKPKDLDRLVGIEDNDLYIRKMVELTEVQLCMWGSIINDTFRGQHVYKMLSNPYCLGINPDGQPKHSLYIGYDIPMVKYCR
jgi:hypothetical protein